MNKLIAKLIYKELKKYHLETQMVNDLLPVLYYLEDREGYIAGSIISSLINIISDKERESED